MAPYQATFALSASTTLLLHDKHRPCTKQNTGYHTKRSTLQHRPDGVGVIPHIVLFKRYRMFTTPGLAGTPIAEQTLRSNPILPMRLLDITRLNATHACYQS